MATKPPPPRRRTTPRHAPVDHTPERVLAVAGVAGLLIVLIVSIALIAGGGGGGGEEAATAAESTATATPTPTPTATAKPRPTPAPLTATERAERTQAADLVRSRGFTPVRLRDWDPHDTLRVLIGKTSTGGRMAFFFVGQDYIGNDSTDVSAGLRVKRTADVAATLTYRTYAPGDDPAKPTGDRVDVRFGWDGVRLTPQTAVPAPEQRTPGRQTG